MASVRSQWGLPAGTKLGTPTSVIPPRALPLTARKPCGKALLGVVATGGDDCEHPGVRAVEGWREKYTSHSTLFNSKSVERISGPYDQILLAIQHVGFRTIAYSRCQSRMPEYLSVDGIERD